MLPPISTISNVASSTPKFRNLKSEFVEFRLTNSDVKIQNSESHEKQSKKSELNISDAIFNEAVSPSTKVKIQKLEDEREFRELFHKFIGQVLFGQMLKSMRATQQKNPYFHGGRAEEIFQDELDNKLVEQLTGSTTKNLSEPMYNQFKRQQKGM
ncbi:MAG: rod-binding protein [Planctomycetaceae bacterium]|jgi:Rod binding domain-containing protein|nr:rod-binding protein [Planctomycetaceae bacterium]